MNVKNMKRTIGAGTACVALAASVMAGSHRAAGAQSANTPARRVPRVQADASWAKIPNGWVFGQVASAATDEQDHVWVLHRPRVVRPDQKTGPPVMEFDAAGNFIQGWGGPAEGYAWPQSEHGIYVDYKGYVWIGGSGNDDQILKFTKAGKFVMQIGRGGQKKTNQDTQNVWRAADIFVYQKTNELFVADGYGNKRIIVFDADTGAYKRMWGAFGNVPTDDPATGQAGQRGETGAAGQRGGGRQDLTRIPAKELDPKDPGPPQFSIVHGVKVSNDGRVYVSDRSGKRVQGFTIDGKFLTQAVVDRWCGGPRGANLSSAAGRGPAGRRRDRRHRHGRLGRSSSRSDRDALQSGDHRWKSGHGLERPGCLSIHQARAGNLQRGGGAFGIHSCRATGRGRQRQCHRARRFEAGNRLRPGKHHRHWSSAPSGYCVRGPSNRDVTKCPRRAADRGRHLVDCTNGAGLDHQQDRRWRKGNDRPVGCLRAWQHQHREQLPHGWHGDQSLQHRYRTSRELLRGYVPGRRAQLPGRAVVGRAGGRWRHRQPDHEDRYERLSQRRHVLRYESGPAGQQSHPRFTTAVAGRGSRGRAEGQSQHRAGRRNSAALRQRVHVVGSHTARSPVVLRSHHAWQVQPIQGGKLQRGRHAAVER